MVRCDSQRCYSLIHSELKCARFYIKISLHPFPWWSGVKKKKNYIGWGLYTSNYLLLRNIVAVEIKLDLCRSSNSPSTQAV